MQVHLLLTDLVYSRRLQRIMLYLKPANFEDLDAEYEYVKEMPIDENGFENSCFGISKSDFEKNALPKMINFSKGIDLPCRFAPHNACEKNNKKMYILICKKKCPAISNCRA
ncbi:MAG: hypothetical protein E7063_07880 [Spirochaetaceae bacterium]|nr:hypothetical protein [Spirochaetaceae bacterium]